MTVALVPLKDLVQAKSRLGGVLCPSERRALAQAMVEDVLDQLGAHPAIRRVVLLSADPGAALLAARYHVEHWTDAELGGGDLNQLLGQACARLAAEGEAPLFVLHADLPLLAPADIDAALAAHIKDGAVVIGSDRRGGGTNLLVLPAAPRIALAFGRDSCARHRAAATAAGLPVVQLERTGIQMDVDDAEDLGLLQRELTARRFDSRAGSQAGRTGALLVDTDLGRRVALTNMAAANVDVVTGGDSLGRS